MRKKLLLLQAFIKREFIILKRYWLNTLGSMLTVFVIFLVLFGGYQGLKTLGTLGGDTAEAIVVGYILWFFLLSTHEAVAATLRVEAYQGTLEQLYMSSHGFGWVIGAKIIASFLRNIITVSILFAVAVSATGTTLNLDLVSLFPVLIGTLLGSLGIGFVIGGLTLVFKQLTSFTQMVQFAIVFLIALPADRILWMRLLPSSYGASLIQHILVRSSNLSDLGLGAVMLLFAVGILHLALGYGVYKVCEQRAMRLGMLGHY